MPITEISVNHAAIFEGETGNQTENNGEAGTRTLKKRRLLLLQNFVVVMRARPLRVLVVVLAAQVAAQLAQQTLLPLAHKTFFFEKMCPILVVLRRPRTARTFFFNVIFFFSAFPGPDIRPVTYIFENE